ncbi:MAG TPA: sulfatase-like hydrolase/transferase [Sphingobacterium bovisgrunnientis]|jgi:arylsulfatase A|nr:sulfatase-like hydrolase/transferase [Sphingobacterium bovisgrunnientis]
MIRILVFIRTSLVIVNLLIIQMLIAQTDSNKPNVIIIYADDLGYGDLSSYGAIDIQTPNLDKLAKEGTRFTNAHSTSATCTPSRFALITGNYPWRLQGTGVLPGDAKLIVPIHKTSLPKVFKKSEYKTAIVGKWHLGLGNAVEKDWNQDIKPGPNEIGFDYSFIFPATADRVPTVFLENHRVVGLDSSDPIRVNYVEKVGADPTGRDNPELLKMKASPNHGHNNTIVNGIGRIGYMEGGHKARWVDEEVSGTFLHVAQNFIEENKISPFFLLFSLTEPHVPRMPATYFKGKSKLGYRGDAILQLDWTVGQIIKQLDQLGISKNTIIVFTSDNGPVLDDGYQDESVEKNNNHKSAGPFRGGKYSIFEAGTRVPFIIAGKGIRKNYVSNALFSQIDLIASFAQMLEQPNPMDAKDSEALFSTLQGLDDKGRSYYIKQGYSLAIIKDNWKYIEPSNASEYNPLTDIELGNSKLPQLYNLTIDQGEKYNLASKYPEKLKELKELLEMERRK